MKSPQTTCAFPSLMSKDIKTRTPTHQPFPHKHRQTLNATNKPPYFLKKHLLPTATVYYYLAPLLPYTIKGSPSPVQLTGLCEIPLDQDQSASTFASKTTGPGRQPTPLTGNVTAEPSNAYHQTCKRLSSNSFTNGSQRLQNRTKQPQATLPTAPSANIPKKHEITLSPALLQHNLRYINTCYEMLKHIATNTTAILTSIVSSNLVFNIFQTHPSTKEIFQNTSMISSSSKHKQGGINYTLDVSQSNGSTNRKITPYPKDTKITVKNG